MAKDKERLDVLLVNRGLAPSREKAKTLRVEFYSKSGKKRKERRGEQSEGIGTV